jgi:hypothetical protein
LPPPRTGHLELRLVLSRVGPWKCSAEPALGLDGLVSRQKLPDLEAPADLAARRGQQAPATLQRQHRSLKTRQHRTPGSWGTDDLRKGERMREMTLITRSDLFQHAGGSARIRPLRISISANRLKEFLRPAAAMGGADASASENLCDPGYRWANAYSGIVSTSISVHSTSATRRLLGPA